MTPSLPRLVILSLGGTITMTRSSGSGIVPTLTAEDLVRAAPGLAEVAAVETVSPFRKAGPSLTIDDLLTVAALLRERFQAGVDGAIVVQGTDTIEETSFALDRLLPAGAPVVVTGAMRGPEAPGADGPANILAAARVAASAEARGRGVLVVLNDEVHAARYVQKSHTALPSAFTSPLCGAAGLVAEGRVRFWSTIPTLPAIARPPGAVASPVALLTMSLGDDGRLLAELPKLGFAGAVIAGMGVGHTPAVLAPIAESVAAHIPVVLASRIQTGPSFAATYGYPGSEIDLLGRGLISAGHLSALKARMLLELLLRAGSSRVEIAEAFRHYA